ncbi:MAG: AAA family ATPase [Myxococcaceae bacterium]|nr:AAA family ATPase [Myxococcaceae bacterium]
MRFHRLEVTNLNSLYGTHTVDFDAVAGDAGMFLIHGPTGAGKSTLLDAICLALYGQTPRLDGKRGEAADGRRDGAPEDGPARVMSLGEGACAAVLELSVTDEQGTRTRYRAGWAVHRARRRAEGDFQAPRRRLEEWVNGEWRLRVDSDKLKEFREPFEALLRGLTFVDFQRSVLLAQFKFREFLEADPRARTDILERVTDTTHFRAIGKRAMEAHRLADQQVKALEQALAGQTLLSSDERAALEAAREGARAGRDALTHELASLEGARAFWTSLLEARAQLDGAHQRQAEAARALGGAAPALAALAEDARVAPGRVALDEWRTRQREAAEAARQAEAVRAEVTAAEAAARSAQLTHEARAEAHRAAVEARAARLPLVTAAEQAWADARQAALEAAQAATRAGDTARELAAASDQADAARAALEAHRAAAATAGAQLARLPAADHVVEASGAITVQAEALAARTRAADDARAALERGANEALAAAARRAPLEVRANATAEAERAATAAARAAEEALSTCTAGATADDFTTRLDEARAHLERRLRQLEALGRDLSARDRLADEVARLEAEVATARAARDDWAARGAALEASRARLAAAAAADEQHARTLDALLAVLERRDVLQPGEPCPVCGSEEHPYRRSPGSAPPADEHRARRDELTARLERTRREHDEVSAALEDARRRASAAEGRTTTLAAELEGRRATLAGATRALDATARDAGLGDVTAVTAATTATTLEQARAETTREQVRALEAALRSARAEASAAAASAREAALAVEHHDGVVRLVAERRSALEAAAAALTEEERAARDQLTAGLARLAVTGVEPAEGAALVAERARKVRELRARLEACAREVTPAELALASAAARLEALQRGAEQLAAEAAQRAARAEALRLSARAHLGGDDPAAARAALDAAVAAATTGEATAQRALAAAEQQRASLAARLDERTALAATRASAATAAHDALSAALTSLGLSSPEALTPLTLTDAARADAEALRSTVERDARTAAALVEAAEQRCASLLRSRPAGEPDGSAAPARLEELQARVAAAQAGLEQRAAEVARCEQRLGDDDAARAAHDERAHALEQAREQHAAWATLQELIGMNNGERFAVVVQALNLQRLLGYANQHLSRFMPRYQLEQVNHVDHGPQLDFRVVDLSQQGAARSIKSLSGGESFVVSLALALGLASMRASRLRVETLLIDEGFGSLDARTLADAHHALEALQGALGVQIGLISHVPYLKEQVAAQVEVRPDGPGRSKVYTSAPGAPTP